MGIQAKEGCWQGSKYKARLVVKGFQQKQGIDFDKILSCRENEFN